MWKPRLPATWHEMLKLNFVVETLRLSGVFVNPSHPKLLPEWKERPGHLLCVFQDVLQQTSPKV